MKTLAIPSQKGGVGKTTLATCLGVAAEAAGRRTAIIDLDPQATASFWKDVRGAAAPAVETVQPIRLANYLKGLEGQGVKLAILDGAAVAQDITLMAARVADFVLIPARPAVFDTMSMTHTLDVVRGQDRPHAVLLTFTTPQGREAADAAELVQQLGAPLAPITIGARKAFFRAQGAGLAVQEWEPAGAAAREIAALYDYTDKQLFKRKDKAA